MESFYKKGEFPRFFLAPILSIFPSISHGLMTLATEWLSLPFTQEEDAIMKNLSGALPREAFRNRDMPEGTIVTNPYYTDLNVLVTLK